MAKSKNWWLRGWEEWLMTATKSFLVRGKTTLSLHEFTGLETGYDTDLYLAEWDCHIYSQAKKLSGGPAQHLMSNPLLEKPCVSWLWSWVLWQEHGYEIQPQHSPVTMAQRSTRDSAVIVWICTSLPGRVLESWYYTQLSLNISGSLQKQDVFGYWRCICFSFTLQPPFYF